MKKIQLALLAVLITAPAAAPAAAKKAAQKADKEDLKLTVKIEKDDDFYAAGGIIKFGEDVSVAADESVDGPVMVFGGSIAVDGKVEGPVMAFGGSVKLGPKAEVGGPAMSIGGRTSREEGSRIDGPIVDTPGARAGGKLAALFAYIAAAVASAYVILKASAGLGWIVLAVVLAALFPGALRRTKEKLESRPVECFVIGVLAWPVLIFISMTLLISLIGIPLLPFLAALAAAAYVWGFTALALLIGERVSMGRWRNNLASAALGMLLLQVLAWLPVVKWLVCLIVALFGAGVTILSGFGAKTRKASS